MLTVTQRDSELGGLPGLAKVVEHHRAEVGPVGMLDGKLLAVAPAVGNLKTNEFEELLKRFPVGGATIEPSVVCVGPPTVLIPGVLGRSQSNTETGAFGEHEVVAWMPLGHD